MCTCRTGAMRTTSSSASSRPWPGTCATPASVTPAPPEFFPPPREPCERPLHRLHHRRTVPPGRRLLLLEAAAAQEHHHAARHRFGAVPGRRRAAAGGVELTAASRKKVVVFDYGFGNVRSAER